MSIMPFGTGSGLPRLRAKSFSSMQIQDHRLLKIAATGTAGFAFAGAVQAATILTGDGQADNEQVPVNHGSNALGTPNVSLTWDDAWDSYAGWPNDPGDGVYQHDNEVGTPHTILFSPDASWNIVLVSLDVNVWAGGGATDVAWSVAGSLSGNLGSGTFSNADDSVVSHPLGITGVDGEALTLSLTQESGSPSYLAIDNLSFDQVAVPEASTAALAVLGMGAAAMRRRRRG